MSFKNHILNSISTQEVNGCSKDGSLTGVSWSKNGEKIEDRVSQTNLLSRISYQVSNHFNYLQKGSNLY